jgi:hypothetical protein
MLYESFVSKRARGTRVGKQFRPAFAGFRPETTETIVSKVRPDSKLRRPKTFGKNSILSKAAISGTISSYNETVGRSRGEIRRHR